MCPYIALSVFSYKIAMGLGPISEHYAIQKDIKLPLHMISACFYMCILLKSLSLRDIKR
jgi:hypothetical protein